MCHCHYSGCGFLYTKLNIWQFLSECVIIFQKNTKRVVKNIHDKIEAMYFNPKTDNPIMDFIDFTTPKVKFEIFF